MEGKAIPPNNPRTKISRKGAKAQRKSQLSLAISFPAIVLLTFLCAFVPLREPFGSIIANHPYYFPFVGV